MIGHRRLKVFPEFGIELEPSIGDQLMQDQTVMACVEVCLRIFISKGVKAVGRRGHHLRNVIFLEKVETIIHLLHIEPKFTNSPRNVSAARLFLSQDAEIHPGSLEDF